MSIPKSSINDGLPQDNESGDRNSFSAITRRSFFQYLGAVPGFAALPALNGQGVSKDASKHPEGGRLGLSGILPFRQIHLDFHTSSGVPSVGEAFNTTEFAEILKGAYVNSIAIFAKCNQGMSYYPTKVGVMHPGDVHPTQ